jgi:hypothetical protein
MKLRDLKFEPHPAGMGGTRATVHFPNGYGASVVTGSVFYTSSGSPYEMAVLDGDGITYDTPITDDVLGYLTKTDVESYLGRIAELPMKEAV